MEEDWKDIPDIKDALKLARRNLDVAIKQIIDLQKELCKEYEIQIDSFQSLMPHHFLKIPDPPTFPDVEKDFLGIIEHLKKYFVIINQMITEVPEGQSETFKESLEDSKMKLLQLMESFVLIQNLIGNSNDTIDAVFPKLPDEIDTSKSRSNKLLRDVLAIREYNKLLSDHIHNTLNLYEA